MLRFLVLVCLLTGCTSVPPVRELSGDSMGSRWTVKLDAAPDRLPALERGIQAQLDQVVAQMSTWEETSHLSRYNQAPAGSWHHMPPEFLRVLDFALSLARDTGGAYDPTVGPLVNVWGFGPEGTRATPPTPDQVAQARARVGWQRLTLDVPGARLRQPGGTYLDLSSVATGFGVDQVARYLQAQGVPGFLVELGGELRAAGRRPDGQPWRVGVERPPGEGGSEPLLAQLVLQDQAIGSSGDFRNFFEQGGQRYSHHIDPRTGQTVTSRLASVTVLHPECMQADALAMAITALGPDEGYAWAQARGLAALLVLRADGGLEERMTPAFRKALAQ